jgi:hypothetical protein
MIADDEENFVSRWSRRKIEARKTEEKPPEPAPSPAPAAVPSAPSADAAATQADAPARVELPPVESLKGLASEYRDFMQPGVDDNLRRSALKKLFSDPHFENFERFEAYCEDFTQSEPIPLAMLKTLEHAKGLLFDEDKKEDKKEDRKEDRKEDKKLLADEPPTALPEPEMAAEPEAFARAGSAAAPEEPEGKT